MLSTLKQKGDFVMIKQSNGYALKFKNKKTKIVGSILTAASLCAGLIALPIKPVYASPQQAPNCRASVLIEKNTHKVLKEYNSHNKYPIASVTKLMTVLITLENVEENNISLDDMVTVSKNASGMGGSQIFLDADTDYKLGDLLKSVIVCSANDSSVALAEHIAGSENNFVRTMNQRAQELNMQDTNYVNCTGLPAPQGYSSAYDQAILLSHVLDYDVYHQYSSIWNEEFTHPSGRTTQMTNTNKLSRFYDGCIGGKTGSTNEAKYCLSVGARRGDMQLISCVLGADTSPNRFKIASDLLNFGFDNFESKTIFNNKDLANKTIAIKGKDKVCTLSAIEEYSFICQKGEQPNYSLNFNLPSQLKSCKQGQVVGNVEIVLNGKVEKVIDITANETISEASIWDYIKDIVA